MRRILSVGVVAAAAVCMGCTGNSAPPPDPVAVHLRTIGQAYDMALYKNRRPPKSADDLKPFLQQINEQEDPEVYLRSPNDGQPYEIVWGVNLDHETNGNAVLVYEKQGKDGKRHVMTVARIVREVADAEFEVAEFPKGRKPAKGK